MQLRRLRHEKLRVAAEIGLVALNGEVGVHRIARRQRRQQIALPTVHCHQIADLKTPFRLRIRAQRCHQSQSTRAGDLHIEVVIVEAAHRDSGDRPDVVEVHFRRQHIHQRFHRARLTNRNNQFLFRCLRCTELRRAGLLVLGHTERILPRRDLRHAGIKRRADG